MVLSMPLDRGRLPRVAWLGLFCACSPLKPPEPPPEPGPVAKIQPQRMATTSGRHVVVGEMCPQGAGGRPGVAPLIMRNVGWTDKAEDVTGVIERGGVPRFVVFGVDGKVAGLFDTVGLAEVGLPQSIASGTYVGAPPCTSDGGKGTRIEDPKCTAAFGGCGLAVGELVRPDDPPETTAFQTAGACASGDNLVVDIDGDGAVEAFPLAGALDGIRGPAAEWSAATTAGAPCRPTFQLHDLQLAPEPVKGKVDPKAVVVIDVMGVVDLDGDGRKELVLSMKFPTVRTIVVYTASGSPQRLAMVGEAMSFSR